MVKDSLKRFFVVPPQNDNVFQYMLFWAKQRISCQLSVKAVKTGKIVSRADLSL